MLDHASRRDFLRSAVAAGITAPLMERLSHTDVLAAKPLPPSEKLNLGIIGVAGRGGSNLKGVSSENIVVLCDIDQQRLGQAAEQFPKAKTCDDFRRVFDHKGLDGVVISTPDHMHAIPTTIALKQGLAVYCEKPLTHSLFEARVVSHLTAETNAVTQMGNQIHNHESGNYRRVVEIVQSGQIGDVRRVHVWQGGGINWHFGVKLGERAQEANAPESVNYDLWLGPAPYRPFHESHFHFNWRYWWDFGGGQLADFVCHYMDLPYWALKLQYPTTVVATGKKGHGGDNQCPHYMRVDYEFSNRDGLPPVHVTWYHGGWKPKGAEIYGKNSAVLFEGNKGRLLADYTTRKLFMQDGKQVRPTPPFISDSVGHHQEWINAIKSQNTNTTCNFQYGALLTEAAHLGNISYRVGQKKLTWDAEQMQTSYKPAQQLIRREYRKGWTLEMPDGALMAS